MNHECEQCSESNDGGEWSEDDQMLTIRSHIFEFGLHIVGVAGDPVSWTYTIGLAELALPELIVTDIPFECAGTLLNSIARQMISGSDASELAAEIDCRLQDVHNFHVHNSDLLALWANYYRSTWGPAEPVAPRFCQLLLGQSQFCIGSAANQTDLRQPMVRMLRPARRIPKRPAA